VFIFWAVMPALEEYPSAVDAAWEPGKPAPGLEQHNYFEAL
jgi:hypothetical protein